jgi:hypothetical protein
MLPPLSRRIMDRTSDEFLLGKSSRQDAYDDPESPFISTFRAKPMSSAKGKRRTLKTICTVLGVVSLLSFGVVLLKPLSYLDIEEVPVYSTPLNSQSYVQGPPTQRFRGQLIRSRHSSRISHHWSQITFVTTQSTLHRGFLRDGVRHLQPTAMYATDCSYYLLANDVMTYVSQ